MQSCRIQQDTEAAFTWAPVSGSNPDRCRSHAIQYIAGRSGSDRIRAIHHERWIRSGVAVYTLYILSPVLFYPGDSISHPGGYTDLSVKYPGSGYFIPGSHLASPR